MKVAVPVCRERISPVFDTAETLLVVDVEAREETSRYRIDLHNKSFRERVDALTAGGVDALLCGAISRPLCDTLETAGIEVTPFLSGRVEILLRAYIDGQLSDPGFYMPGRCRRLRRRGNRRRNGTNSRRG